jgi:DNA (cytosine-5)-methyltransferase 1
MASPSQSSIAGYNVRIMGIDMQEQWSFCEFFAGGGMARAGLGPNWSCDFANDFSPMKAETYMANWGSDHFVPGDVAKVSSCKLPKRSDLVWASFPCQDLSLAGKYQGLGEASSERPTRSGTFWPFWSLMLQLRTEGRAPRLIVLENVPGTISSRHGRDFEAICNALAAAGYRYGAMVIDAKHFVPQSRPRLFFVAIAEDMHVDLGQAAHASSDLWHTDALCAAQIKLENSARENWIWWNLPRPPARNIGLADLIEDQPTGCLWHTRVETERLLSLMAPLHLTKIKQAMASGKRLVGGVYKRTRVDQFGVKRQRAEVRFDDIAGCLRTPGGGSSRQSILVVEGSSIRSRLLSPREAARLMGLSDSYNLPSRYNDAYHVAGDGVCVPVVRYIASQLLEPILAGSLASAQPLAA